jgi:hypothetical protein
MVEATVNPRYIDGGGNMLRFIPIALQGTLIFTFNARTVPTRTSWSRVELRGKN